MGNRTMSKREIEEMKKKEEEQAAAQVIIIFVYQQYLQQLYCIIRLNFSLGLRRIRCNF